MRNRKLAMGLLAAAVFAVPATIVFAKRVVREFDAGTPTFELAGRPIGGAKAASPTAAYLTSARITAQGDGALVIDPDSGALIKTDKAGKNVAQVAIGNDAGLLTYDPVAGVAYVANRLGDSITVVNVTESKLEVARTIKTPAEP